MSRFFMCVSLHFVYNMIRITVRIPVYLCVKGIVKRMVDNINKVYLIENVHDHTAY